MVEEADSVTWSDWLDHWSVRGNPAMQFEVRALRSLLDEWPPTGTSEIRVAWYRIGPDRWSVLIGVEGGEFLPFPAWREQERSSYRSTVITKYRTANGQTLWLTRRSGWHMLAFQRSVLQDAIIADPVPRGIPSSRMTYPLSDQLHFLEEESGVLGFRQKSKAYSTPAFAKKELAALPDFLKQGRVLELTARDWLPYTGHILVASGFPMDNGGSEVFLWFADSTGQWDDWWDKNRTGKGTLPGFSHQGVRVDRVLDERWQSLLPASEGSRMPAPYVISLNDGWVLSNSEEGIKRWMDYVLLQKTFQSWLPDLSSETMIAGWTHTDSEFGQRQRAKIGPLLPKGETWFWLHKKDRITLVGADPGEGQSELLWQSTDIDGPIRFWQYLSKSLWVSDQRSLQQWSVNGTLIRRHSLVGNLLGGVQQSQIGEEIIWLAGTTSGLYAWDVHGQPVAGSPFRPSSGSFIDWTHRLGTDRQLYRFALESSGQVRGIAGRGVPAVGWPRQVNGARGIVSLRTDTEDALVVLGENIWQGYTLDGYDRWELAAPGLCRQWVTGPESGTALVRLADGRLLQLTLSGKVSELATGVDTLINEPGGRWVVSQGATGTVMWSTRGVGGNYRKLRNLPGSYPGLSVQGVSEEPWLVHETGNGIWRVGTLDDSIELPGLPGRLAPLIWRRGGKLVVLTGQEDKVVAYQFAMD